MVAGIAPRNAHSRGYPVTPAAASSRGARGSSAAREGAEQAAQRPGLPAPRRDTPKASGATALVLSRTSPYEEWRRAQLPRAHEAYARVQNSRLEWLAAYERVDLLV